MQHLVVLHSSDKLVGSTNDRAQFRLQLPESLANKSVDIELTGFSISQPSNVAAGVFHVSIPEICSATSTTTSASCKNSTIGLLHLKQDTTSKEYPPGPISSMPVGQYRVTSSAGSFYNTFDKSGAPGSVSGCWDYITGAYTGSNVTTAATQGQFVAIPGEWLTLELPQPISVQQYKYLSHSDTYKTLTQFDLLGSSDNQTWYMVHSQTFSQPVQPSTWYTFDTLDTAEARKSYKYLRVVLKYLGNGYINGQSSYHSICYIPELAFFGSAQAGNGNTTCIPVELRSVPGSAVTNRPLTIQISADGVDLSAISNWSLHLLVKENR
ncbi:TPA_asm: lectin [Coelastrella green algae MELD virus]|nr:TPA_asm: lectin [Coelastrella green algae MELD virus]